MSKRNVNNVVFFKVKDHTLVIIIIYHSLVTATWNFNFEQMYSKIKSRILSLVFGLLCTLLICIVFNQNKQNSVQSSEGLIQSKSLIKSTNLQLSDISSNMQMDTDSEIVKRLRNSFIETPSKFPYNLVHPDKTDYSNGQTPFIDSRLNYKVSPCPNCMVYINVLLISDLVCTRWSSISGILTLYQR